MNNIDEFKSILNSPDKELLLLKNKTVLITGALGMLAARSVDLLFYLNQHHNFNIKIVLLARSLERLNHRFGKSHDRLIYLVQDIKNPIVYEEPIDYIIHAAGNSSPYHILNNPMNIIEANVLGSMNIVNLAKEKMIKNLLFTSTREVYGQLKDVDCISENNFGSFNPLDARSCYPESKRMAENIFKSASIQYDIPFNVARIAHSYGPGMALNDGRVIADLLGNAVNGRDIELKSDGLALRSFCYVTDAVIAMFLILLKGQNNEAYNIANECEEISIFELAQTIVGLSDKQLNITRVDPEESNMYCKYPRVSLDTSSLESLGWKPRFNLKYGMSKIINNMEYNSK